METEIIFSGLCAFHNLRGQHADLLESSVILVRTDEEEQDAGSEPSSSPTVDVSHNFSPRVAAAIADRWTRPRSAMTRRRAAQQDPEPDVHIPHISFDSRRVRVNAEADALFGDVPFAPGFRFITLNGVEVELVSDPAGLPTVDPSYDETVAQRNRYWPASIGQWNHDYIPLKGNPPKRSAVVAMMRLGGGRISAGRRAPQPWRFERNGDGPLVGTFAEEVVYSVPGDGGEVVLRLRDIESREVVRELRFSLLDPEDQEQKVTLFIGNNDRDDIDNAVQRRIPPGTEDNDHFRFLNRIVSTAGPGPIPSVVRPANDAPNEDDSGGLSTGPCGPIGTNG